MPDRDQARQKIRNREYENLYPIGEGSGSAGCIMSPATDAMKTVEFSLSYDDSSN